MREATTSRRFGARVWRAVVARVVVFAVVFSAMTAHTCVTDFDASAMGAAIASIPIDAATGTDSTQVPHGLAVHVACGCHVGAPTASGVATSREAVEAGRYFVTDAPWARPSPLALPFEPPRA